LAKVEPMPRSDAIPGTSKMAPSNLKPLQKAEFDDSLSSLSIESEDDGNLMNQAIAAGFSKATKSSIKQQQDVSSPINIPAKPRPSTEPANDSISSVDSGGKDDFILEQCILSGINNVVKKDSKHRDRPLMTSSPKKSLLPTPNTSARSNANEKKQSKKDEDLFNEAIASGMMKSVKQQNEKSVADNFSKLSIADSKNGETTSVIATDATCASTITITDVENSTCEKKKSMKNQQQTMNSNEMCDQSENIDSEKELSHQAYWMMQNGCSESGANVEWNEDNVLERSNEYPANKLSIYNCGDLDDDSILSISNEFMVENEKIIDAKIEDKHKNPDLMLKSVDRLTQELVSTAEYLRSNALTSDDVSDHRMSNSISNNTWSDDITLPSISLIAPMIGSTNDEATFATDQIHSLSVSSKSNENKMELNDKTPTNENYVFDVEVKSNGDEDQRELPKIDFKVGGEIGISSNRISLFSNGPASIDTCSTMSNSTIVQNEARKIANKLLSDSTTSLNLENIQPPSSMDSISLCSFQDLTLQQSPAKTLMKKSLLTGLVAKRALGQQIFCGSVDSVNSMNNLDNIRPPSIMDELLDSMISVDSIVSEVVDPTLGISNYETALSDMEDSLTLRSCQDLSKDETLTPVSSDFSSVESTPKRKPSTSKIGVTKQHQHKRQSEKERYKTYTIAVDMLLKDQQDQVQNSLTESTRRSLNARQRRQEDRLRFETQVISHSPEPSSPSPKASLARRKDDPNRFKTYNIEDDDYSIQAMTANFEFIRTEPMTKPTNDVLPGILNKLNQIKNKSNDDSLDYEHQTSETESQRDHKNSINSEENKSPVHEVITETEISPIIIEDKTESMARVKNVKNSYISPYRMTTKLTPTKNKSVKITKTPVIAKVITKNSIADRKLPLSMPKSNGKLNINSKIVHSKGNKATPIQNKQKLLKVETECNPIAPIRQGTFIKDEPTNENVPVVDEPVVGHVPSQAISKLKAPSTRLSTIPKSDSKTSSPKRTSSIPSSISQLKNRSNSNASMKAKDISSLPVRSNTGINLNNPRKNVTSKIASIWKSPVTNSSSHLNNGSKTTALATPTAANANRRFLNSPIKERIKRSSTCDEIGK
jgi:adenomatosis polyposis coli protein